MNKEDKQESEVSDICSRDFFRYGLYRGFHLDNAYSIFVEFLFRKYFYQNQKWSVHCISFLSYYYFKNHFHEKILEEIKNLRSPWLLTHCHPSHLCGLDSKGLEHYFLKLDNHKFEHYLQGMESLDGWIYNSFLMWRKEVFLVWMKKYEHLFLFALFLIIFLLLGFLMTEKQNSFTLWEQIKGWISFLL